MTRQEQLFLEGIVAEYGNDAVLNELNKSNVIGFAASLAALGGLTNSMHKDRGVEYHEDTPVHRYADINRRQDTRVDDLFWGKVQYVDDFFRRKEKEYGRKIVISPELVVRRSDYYNIPVAFVLSALQIETSCGTSDKAIKYNAPFSQGCWDDGTVHCFFDSQDDALEGYLKLIYNDYLERGKKTCDDLLATNTSFVNYQNKRYASDPDYEKKIRRTYRARQIEFDKMMKDKYEAGGFDLDIVYKL